MRFHSAYRLFFVLVAKKQEEIISKIKRRAVFVTNVREKEPREYRDKMLVEMQSLSVSSAAMNRGLIVSKTIIKPISVISISDFTKKP